MNTSIIVSSLVALVGAASELSLASRVSEQVQLIIVGVTLLALSSILRSGLRFWRGSSPV
jgi:hypothetical protein